jgi:hypothetical protein
MRVETRRSVLEQQGIRVPAFGGKNREGAAPDFQVHMPPSGVIAGKFHNAPRIPLARRRAERCVTRNGLHETNCSRRLPLDHQAEFRVGSTSTVGRNKRHVRTSADRCRMRHCGAGHSGPQFQTSLLKASIEAPGGVPQPTCLPAALSTSRAVSMKSCATGRQRPVLQCDDPYGYANFRKIGD